ncbi:MAG: hypothetical protein DRI69_11700 [Bacteroidetes bacterium]|nr:MAG: hypothetical protein DRI69_11700 [Bacteroidota bacterium]
MNWTIIRNDTQYYAALDRFDEIFHNTSKSKTEDEFDLLSMLIQKYEEDNFSIEEADPIEVIKMKMTYMELKQKDLIPFLGSKATVSKLLAYKAPLNLRHIWALSEKLDLPVQLLARPYRVESWVHKETKRQAYPIK